MWSRVDVGLSTPALECAEAGLLSPIDEATAQQKEVGLFGLHRCGNRLCDLA
jgi:hypothetical protein